MGDTEDLPQYDSDSDKVLIGFQSFFAMTDRFNSCVIIGNGWFP
jgi:hypothetical protein